MKIVKLIRTSLLLSLLLLSSLTFAQNTGTLTVGTDTQPREGKDFAITVTPSNPTVSFGKVVIGYRLPNDEYVETEMRFDKGLWKYTITADYAIPPRIDYYIVATTPEGEESTYPAENYRQNPAYVNISPKGLTDAIVVMMGEDGSKTSPDDFMIMISYYTISDQIDVNSVKLTINGQDVTKESSVTADALNFLPASPQKGKQSISFEAKLLDGTPVGPLNWAVNVVTKGEAQAEEEAEQNYSLSGNVWNEYRYEKTASGTKATDRANATANGNIHWMTYNINLYKSSEESKWKQTSDRYTLKLGTEYLDLTVGDAYPSFSRLMMNGSRVRGTEVNLKTDYINVDFAYGFLRRAVDTRFAGGSVTFNNLTEKDSIDAYKDNSYVVTSQNGITTTLSKPTSKGAYDRNLMAGKLSFGSKKQGFNWGLGFLKSIDDTSSNKYGDEAKANLVMSTDMQLRYDNGRFELYGDAAFSLDNTDIKFSSTQIDSTFKDKLKGAYSTVNNLIPLGAGISAPTSVKTALDYSAFLVGLKLNYWNNYLKVEYLRNGTTFHSEGLPFFQNDIQGLKLNDRLRLFQNKFFLTFGYDLLFDNTNGGKDLSLKIINPSNPLDTVKTYDGTTTRNNIRTGFAVFPGAGLPSFSFDYIRLVNQNKIPANQTASQDNASNTFQISTNYGFSWLKAFHTTSLSFALTKKADLRDEEIYLKRNGLASTDQEVQSIVLSYGTTIGEDLSANLSYNNSTSKYKEVSISETDTVGSINYGSFKETEASFNIIEASLGKGFLDNKLRTTARVNATFSDLNQYIFGANAQYYIFKNFFATSDANFILNEGEDSDLMFTLRLQYVF